MEYNWLIAIGLILIFEGLGPCLFPNKWSALMKKLAEQTPNQLRQMGLMLFVVGCLLVWFAG